jgi:hypothetical protein
MRVAAYDFRRQQVQFAAVTTNNFELQLYTWLAY